MNEIRIFPPEKTRVESGPIQFGDDWPGIFIRGDMSFYYSLSLKNFLEHKDPLSEIVLKGLIEFLDSCNISKTKICGEKNETSNKQ